MAWKLVELSHSGTHLVAIKLNACGTGILDGIADEMQPELTPHLLGILEVLSKDKEGSEQLCITQSRYGEATQMEIDGGGQDPIADSPAESWDGRCCLSDHPNPCLISDAFYIVMNFNRRRQSYNVAIAGLLKHVVSELCMSASSTAALHLAELHHLLILKCCNYFPQGKHNYICKG